MLFLAIVLVFIIYAGLYLLWDAARISLDGPQAIMRSLTDALLVPDHLVFFILRSVLILALLYVIGEYLMSSTRRAIKSSRRKKENRQLSATFEEQADHTFGQ